MCQFPSSYLELLFAVPQRARLSMILCCKRLRNGGLLGKRSSSIKGENSLFFSQCWAGGNLSNFVSLLRIPESEELLVGIRKGQMKVEYPT